MNVDFHPPVSFGRIVQVVSVHCPEMFGPCFRISACNFLRSRAVVHFLKEGLQPAGATLGGLLTELGWGSERSVLLFTVASGGFGDPGGVAMAQVSAKDSLHVRSSNGPSEFQVALNVHEAGVGAELELIDSIGDTSVLVDLRLDKGFEVEVCICPGPCRTRIGHKSDESRGSGTPMTSYWGHVGVYPRASHYSVTL